MTENVSNERQQQTTARMLYASAKARILAHARGMTRGCRRSCSSLPPGSSQRPSWRRFCNPWVELAHVTPPDALGPMVVQFSNSWSLVSVLLCGLSSASLMGTPHVEHEHDSEASTRDCQSNKLYHRESLFVSWGILNPQDLHDAYIVACSTSFFASGCALGLSIVGTCVAMVTPPGVAMHRFVVQHSVMLSAMPMLNAIGGGLAGIALAVGVDMTSGGRVALAALGAATLTTVVVAGTALSAQVGLVRALWATTAKATSAGGVAVRKTVL